MTEIKYIEARAQGIARYSDKLRTEMRHFDDGLHLSEAGGITQWTH